MKLDEQYRIHRLDSNNLVIQRLILPSETWLTIGWYGNSVFSLASGLLRLVIAKHTPKDVKLSEQIEMMELEVVSRMDEIEKMIEEAKITER